MTHNWPWDLSCADHGKSLGCLKTNPYPPINKSSIIQSSIHSKAAYPIHRDKNNKLKKDKKKMKNVR